MTATPQATDDLKALIGPGQQDLFDEFVQEVEQQQAEIAAAERQAGSDDEQQLLAGKFKNAEELEKAYLEAQRLISQRGQQPQPQPQAEDAPLSRDEAIGFYGESIVTAAEEAGIDLGAWDKAVKRGDDTAELRQKLSAQTGIPAQLIEQYEQAFRPNGQVQQPANEGLTDTDVSELKALVGGDEEFTRLSQWAVANLDAAELAEYNAAVDSGNKSAVRFALRSLQLRASQGQAGEPELIGGGKPIKAEVFESQQQAIEAMRKTNSKGQNLYRVDPKYREWFDRTMARSNFPT